MGLDFSHSDAHWTYSGFNRFRIRLADMIGIDLMSMQGFGGPDSWDEIDDDIKLLLDHSDCDGLLTPDECALVAPRLRELVQDWDNDYDKRMALELARGLEYCALNDLDMEFV